MQLLDAHHKFLSSEKKYSDSDGNELWRSPRSIFHHVYPSFFPKFHSLKGLNFATHATGVAFFDRLDQI